MSRLSPVELIRHAATEALAAAEMLVPEWLPEGKRQKREWVARNPVRGDRHAGSFGVSLDTGRWHDFADSSAHGGDLVSLLAYLRRCGQMDAAREIDERLRLGLFRLGALDAQQIEQRRREAEQRRQEFMLREELSQQETQQEACRQASQLWRLGRRPEPLHAYLQRKAVQGYGLRQLGQGRLMVPVVRDRALFNLQFIDPDGSKRYLSGGRVQGYYSPLGKVTPDCRLYVCEGWATGATIHADTGCPVVCAMNAANLKPVAMAMRERFGERVELVIAGDDDRAVFGNPGRMAATQAASAAGALVVFPEWPVGVPVELSDFNDLHLWRIGQWQERKA
ncbi:toprim domain-containing protein [Pseudomonas aeruginosa]